MAIYLGNKLVSPSTKSYSTNKIGEIIQTVCSSTYVPFGCLPCDGSEYTKAQFSELWTNFLIDGKLNTCSYADFNSSLTTYGQCGKFAVDTTNEKFKTPYIKDGAYLTQARTDAELGKAYNESLPNITGEVGSYGIYGTGAFQQVSQESRQSTSSAGYYWHRSDFDASRSSSTYQDNAKVQGDNIRTRFFVVVANGQVNQSTIDWSEWASSLQGKADTDLSNVPNSKGILVESYQNGTSWYRIYSDGWCEQGGTETFTNYKDVSLLKSYASISYMGYVQEMGGYDGAERNTKFLVQSASTLRIVSGLSGQSTTCCWKACGYIS